ncbi:XF1762 family protein [Nonomuraea insulae]|uniref:XF1762 family protein n=1 Tax=Nonomuraea insulae TaxID=1616787 RepID=A0ABW1CZN0_9ACTN
MENTNDNSRRPDQMKAKEDSPKVQLAVAPITIQTAKAFVAWTHRHLGPPIGAKFAVGAKTSNGTLVGVVILGRLDARTLDDGDTAEITHLCTDGTPNVCPFLLCLAWRAARVLGHRRLVTYTHADDPGTSLRAAGYRPVAQVPPEQVPATTSRLRTSGEADNVVRTRWEIKAEGTQLVPDTACRRLPGWERP